MLEVLELNPGNLKDFIYLLKQRGEAPEAYYEWKLIGQPFHSCSPGFIAYENKKPMGCIGIINRGLVDKNSVAKTTTWFCDWYVISGARGTGGGRKLMSMVAQSAKIGFGIPGPAHAQGVAAKAGYEPLSGFCELQVPLHPWRVGYKRYGGSVLRKIVRGLREIKNATRGIKRKKTNDKLQTGFPPIDRWLQAVEKGLHAKVHFERSKTFLEWFRVMPLKNGTTRHWWYYDSDQMFAAGYTETDIWGLQRSKVMELIPLENSMPESVKKLFYLLGKSNIDIVVLLVQNDTCDSLNAPVNWQSSIPLHITITAEEKPGYLSLMDKESSWRDFAFG